MSKYSMIFIDTGFVIQEWDQVQGVHRAITKPSPLAKVETAIKKLKAQEDHNLSTRAKRTWRGCRDA